MASRARIVLSPAVARTPDRSTSSVDTRTPVRPPTTSASAELCGMSRRHYKGWRKRLNAAVARFPFAAAGDPERHEDQFQIEPEAGTFEIQAIEAELAGPRDVARRVDLREA